MYNAEKDDVTTSHDVIIHENLESKKLIVISEKPGEVLEEVRDITKNVSGKRNDISRYTCRRDG